MVNSLKNDQLIQLQFDHDLLKYSVIIGFLKNDQLSVKLIENKFERLVQSFKHDT